MGKGKTMCAGVESPIIIGDGHQLNSRGVYTHYKDFL